MGGKLPTQTYQDILPNKVDVTYLRNKLKLQNLKVKNEFVKKYPHVSEFFKKQGIDISKLREHSAKIIGAGALTGTLLLSPPTGAKPLPGPSEIVAKAEVEKEASPSAQPQKELLDALGSTLPKSPRPLDRSEEKSLEQVFQKIVGVPAKASLEGEHLNTTYGLIGAEQHLRRYPGDSLYEHGSGSILQEGIAPGLGAWGYFAPSESKLTPDLVEKEKWYAVVQTLYLPDWNTRQPYLQQWYKYRKVLIVNTDNGNAVVADIADSGPAAFTGKSFGGSPEVMDYLGGPKYKKGPVVLFFVDDPQNKTPLGPVDYNKISVPLVALKNI